MKRKYLILLFAIMAIAQAAVPVKMVYDSEMAENYGTVYKFKTAPIDPNDPFRGKYVSLNYDISRLTTKDFTWATDEKIYVGLKTDKDGFARAATISRQKPLNNENYFVTTVNYSYAHNNSVHINIPFNRFYMEEGKALEAETGYREYSTGVNAKTAYALVAIRNGNAVLKDVIIDDIPIKDYVVRERNKK